MEKEVEAQIRNLQIFEQNLQTLLVQKQAFQLELGEIEAALSELKIEKGDVYKIVGNIMVKSKREILSKELNEKKDLLNLRIKNIEKQEQVLKNKVEDLRKDVLKVIK